MIRILPTGPGWAASLTERLLARPGVDDGPRFTLPEDGDDAGERRRAPTAPKELGLWDGPPERTSHDRVTAGGGSEGRAGSAEATSRRRDGRPGEAGTSAPEDAGRRADEAEHDAALRRLEADAVDGVDAEAREAGRATREARAEAARTATGEARAQDAARAERPAAPPRGEHGRSTPEAQAGANRSEAPAPMARAATEAADAKAARPTPPNGAQGASAPQAPAAAPPVTPASAAMNAELARLLALTSDGEDPLLPTGRPGGDLELSPLALGAAELRGAHPSLQRVNPVTSARDVAAKIAEAVADMAADAEGDGVLRLDGAEIGRFLARIELTGRDLVVRLHGHDAAAQALLSSRAPEVRAELARAAVVAGGVDVRAEADGQGGGEDRRSSREGDPTTASEAGEVRPARARRRSAAHVTPMDETDGRRGGRVDLIA